MGLVTLTTLVLHANISNYAEQTWLKGAELRTPYLFVPMPDDAARGWIEKHYLPKFRELIPELELRPLLQSVKPKPAKATKHPALKPGKWRDLLDEQG